MKNKYTGLMAMLLAAAFALCGCGDGRADDASLHEATPYTEPSSRAGNITDAISEYGYAPEDLDSVWDESAATVISLGGASAQINGNGAAWGSGSVIISQAGTYVLAGVLSDGQIIIDAGKDDLVRLVLNGVNLNCSTSAPVYSKQAGKTVLILAEDTENTINDGTEYAYAAGEDEPDAAVFAKDDLTITGSGALTVIGNFYNGIGSKDVLCITGGKINVTATNDGLRGRDGIAILDGEFIIEAQNDGIKSNHDTDAEKGFILLQGGSFYITAGCDGIQAETVLTVTGGEYMIFAGGGADNAPTRQGGGWSRGGQMIAVQEASESMKGLKAGTVLTISGGTFNIDAQDDAVHSNGDILMIGGSLTIRTGDDGFHADGNLTASDGVIDILICYEGLEGATVDIIDGEIAIKSTDDGINAGGGNDADSYGPMGGDRFAANSSYYLRIAGGSIEIDSDGDGIDSNGKLYIDGGNVVVHGPSSSGNGALDAESGIEVNGGHLIAVGAAGMHQSPNSTSAQPSLSVYFNAR